MIKKIIEEYCKKKDDLKNLTNVIYKIQNTITYI